MASDDPTSAEPEPEEMPAGRPPPLLERLRGVLLDPAATFARHDPGWGWLLPWLIVSAAGVLYGLLVLGVVDVGALARAGFEREASERSTAPAGDEEDDRQDDAEAARKPVQLTTGQKLRLFGRKLSLVAGPPLFGLVGLVFAGGFAWLAAVALGPRGQHRELLRGVSIAAWAGLADLGGYALRVPAVLLGNPDPETNPAHVVDAFESPLLAAALGRFDPVLAWYYALFALGLAGSYRLAGARAAAAALGLWILASLPHLGIGLLAKLGQTMGGGA